MATYAEYQQQRVASSSNDFTLYPTDWNYDQSFMPQTTFDEQNYMTATSFDHFPSETFNDQYAFDAEQQYTVSKPEAQNYSPASHPFEYQQAPILSSTSDSGASVQSTISSAMASPSVQPQHSEWNQQLIPSIVHHDSLHSDLLAASGFELDTIPVTDKGCVGESTAVSFTVPQSQLPVTISHQFNSNDGNVSPVQQPFAVPGDWPLPDAFFRTQEHPHPRTRATSTALPAIDVSPQTGTASPSDNIFQSPTTPASASSPFHPRSPVLERVKGRRPSVAPLAKRQRGLSPLTQAVSYEEDELPERPHAPPPSFSSPFFSQSSGYFVPPLGSSCLSPLHLFFSLSFFSWQKECDHLLTGLYRSLPHPAVLAQPAAQHAIPRSSDPTISAWCYAISYRPITCTIKDLDQESTYAEWEDGIITVCKDARMAAIPSLLRLSTTVRLIGTLETQPRFCVIRRLK